MIKCLNPITIGIVWFIGYTGLGLSEVGKKVISILALILILISCFLGV